MLVGFRELAGRYVAEIEACRVLDSRFSDQLMNISALLGELSIVAAVPQLEIAAGDDQAAIIVRHLEPLEDADEDRLRAFSDASGIAVYLQPAGPDSIRRLAPDHHQLSYGLPEFGLQMNFQPQHFIQVNAAVNRALVVRAVELLAPKPDETVLDLFCGLGNFSLPLATRAGRVIGIEAEPALVAAARQNARGHGLENVRFLAADLYRTQESLVGSGERVDAVLIDPPRSGALEVMGTVAATGASRIGYVSCDPATLARDAAVLVKTHGYVLRAAGIADMFPQTAHVESVALFERDQP